MSERLVHLRSMKIRPEFALRVRSTTLFRFIHHRQQAFQSSIESAGIVASLRIKWDETEQIVGLRADVEECGRFAGLDLKKSGKKAHIMVTTSWCKTDNMPLAMPWLAPAKHIQRTTSECIYAALKLSTPWGPWAVPFKDVQFCWASASGIRRTDSVIAFSR